MQGLVKVTKKLGTSFLAMCLILAMMPVNVFAEGETSGGIAKLEITASDDVKKSSKGIDYFVIGSNKENSFKLSAKQTPGTASDEVTWSSNQESKGITIDENGIVKVDYKETTATYPTFTATSKENESVQAKYSLYILPEMSLSTSDSIEFTLPEDGTLLKENDKYFKVKPDQYETYGVIEWTSENTDVATVKSNGTVCFVTAVKPGVTKVIGKNKENKDNKVVGTVTVKGVMVEAKDGARTARLLPNKTIELQAFGENKDDKFTWKSSNEEVAKVDENGVVTGLKEGNVLITATNESGAKGGFKINVKRAEDAPYLDNLELTNYSSFNEWTSATSEFESSKFDYTLTTKSANNSTFNANYRPTFDDTKYKVEIFNNDKLVKTVEKSTTSQAVALEPGANKVVIRISDLTNEKNYTDYKFDITRTRSTTATLAFSGATIVPSERALISNPTYKGRSEGTFFRLENGELTNVAGISPTISDYKTFLYKDINSFDLNISPKDSWSIVRASIDDGEAVNVEKGKPIKNIKFGDKNSVKIKIQICSNSKYYANKEDGKEDPFEAENTYTITVERLSVDKSELQITSADISSGQWCTPEFNKDIVTAAILIPKDCNSLDINFKVTNGATVYKDSKSDANLLNAEEDGSYKLTIDTSKITSSLTQRIVLYKVLEDGSEMITTYTFTIYKRGKLVGMPDKVVDYFCPGSQYSNMGNYGLYPEKSLIGSGNWYTPISLGNFGGSITYYYENGIKNDPTNPYGIDFTIFGNSNGGQSFSEPGNVIVSKDGVNWYTLAGSEHYDDKAIWGYELTYIRNGNGTACSYKDSLGKSDDMTAMYKYALKENYPLHKFDTDADKQVTVKGTLLVNDSKDPYGSSAAAYPDFGYVDVHTNSSTVAGTGENVDLLTVPVGNPYTGNYNRYGDGFDLDWAVDEDGYPVKLDEIHYVKVQTASFIMAGAIGEKSTEVNAVTRTIGEKTVGKTELPTSIKVGDKEIKLQQGVNEYNVEFGDNFDVTVNASKDANIYINDKRGATRTYTSKPDKGIIRIIVQEGEKEPAIIYLTNKKVNTVDVNFDADNGEDVITKSVASGETLDYKPEAPTKDGYTFVGWYKDTDDITTEYKSGATYTESVTYKAKWAHVTMLGAQGELVVDGKSGIRFGTKLYNDGDQIVEKGTLIIPANLVGEGEKLTLDTPKVAISKANVLYQVDYNQNFMTYLGTIVNIPEVQFNRPMTAASYVIYKDKAGNQYTVYSQYPNGSISVYDLLGNDVDWDEKWDETK